MTFEDILARIEPIDEAWMELAMARWNGIAKPIGGLGLLETSVTQIAGIQHSVQVDISRRACVVMCADNGVVAEGVTQTDSGVTAVVTESLAAGHASVNAMARVAGCDIIPVDIGVAQEISHPDILSHKIAFGTKNIACEPAMTRAQAIDAITYGALLVQRLKNDGYTILATGEMGIGNTTTTGAVVAVLLGLSPELFVGRGAGLSDEGLIRKKEVISRAIAINQPDNSDPIDVLHKVGGLDLAGLAGVFLGGAAFGVPIIIDGAISAAAALIAMRICPRAKGYWLASHLSKEPAARATLDALGLSPIITAELCLGEGTGAVALLPLLDMALAVYRESSSFLDVKIPAYQPQGLCGKRC